MRCRSWPIFCCLAAACASITVTDDYDRAVDFAALKTWSWRAPKPEAAPPTEPMPLVDARIRAALEQTLVQKGYPRATATGDFEVAFHTMIEQRLESQPGTYYGYGWRSGRAAAYSAPEYYTYDEGTLLVDFIDPKTNHIVWRGTASAVVDRQASAEARERRIQDAVHKLLARFPPPKG
ncbi:MAG: DUF4136 domain-containing protein [Planctomycetes bacterium]|nr:DUF4136 domain-containing protein [Planctomycetota bacterium]